MNDSLRNILNGGYDAFSEDSEDFVVKAYNAYKLRPDKYSDTSGLILSEAFNRIRKKKHEYVPSNAAVETTPKTDQELYEKYSENTEGLDVTNLNIPVGGFSKGKGNISADDAEQMGLAHLDERQVAYYLNNKDAIDSQAKNGAFNLIPDNEFDADDSEEDKALSRETYRVLAPIVEGYNPLDWKDPRRKKELEKEIYASLNAKLSNRIYNNVSFFVDGFVNSIFGGHAPSYIPQEMKEKIPMTTGQTVSNLGGNLLGMFLPAGGISKGVGLGMKAISGASKPVLAHMMKQFPHFLNVGKLALQHPKSVYIAGSTTNRMMQEGLTLGLYGQAVKHPEGTTIEDRVKEFGSHFLEGSLYGAIGLSSTAAAANKTLRPYELQAFMAEMPLVGYMSYKMELSRNPDDVMGAVIAGVTNTFMHGFPAYSGGYIKKSDLIDNAVKIADLKWGNEVKQGARKGFEALFDEMPPAQRQHALWQYEKIRNERFKNPEFDENQGKIKDLTVQERDAIVQKKIKEDGIEQFPEDIESQKLFDEKMEAERLAESENIAKQAEEKARKEGIEKEEAQEKVRSDIATGRADASTGEKRVHPTRTDKENISILQERGLGRGLDKLDLWDNGKGYVSVDMISVPEKNRGKGLARETMNEVVDYADNYGKILTLTPTSEFGSSKSKLVKFYKELGFVENKGANKDFNSRDGMIRYPRENRPIDVATPYIRKGSTFDNDSGTEGTIALDKINPTGFNRLRGGSVRDVYDIGEGKVIKIAKHPRGLEQNNSIGWGDSELLGNKVPMIYEMGQDYLVVENVPRNDKELKKFLKPLQEFTSEDFRLKNSKLQEVMHEMGLDDFRNYDLLWGDFKHERNWGMRDDGTFVLTDEGALNHDVHAISEVSSWAKQDWAEILHKRRIARKEWVKTASDIDLLKEAGSKVTKAFPVGLSVKETSRYVKKDGTQVTADEFQNLSKEKDFVEEDWMPVDEYIEERGELKSILSEIWNRKKLEGKATYDDFKDAVKELGAGGKIVMSKEIFNDIEQDLRITKVRDLVEQYNEKGLKDPNDPIINTKTEANSSEEYVGNILKKKFDSGGDEGVAIQAVLENLFSGTEFKASQGQRGWSEIIGKSLEKPFLAKVIEKIAKRDYSAEKLHLSEHLVGVRYMMAESLDLMLNNTDPEKAKAFESLFKAAVEQNISLVSEVGRALQASKIKTGKLNEGKVAQALKELNLNRDVRKMLGDLLENPELLQKPEMKWKFVEWARNAKLASVSSLTRSVVGNAVSHTLHVGDMATAPLYNRLLTKIANKWMGTNYTQSIRAEESLLYFAGVKKGFKPALKTAWDVMRENDMAIQDNSFLRNEGFSQRNISGKKGLVIRAPQNAQGGIDVFHRLPAIHGQLYRYASRAAQEFFHKNGIKPSMSDRIKKVNELVENPTSDILQKAYADAEFITFQERPTDILSKHLSHLRKQSSVAQFFVPFQNTPTNIFKQAFYSRSPIGLLHKGFKTAWKIANKRITQEGLNDASTELSRATTGTLAQLGLSGLMYKVLEGEITSSGRDMTDEQRRLAETDHGWMPNAIKLTDKNGVNKYYSFEGYEPVASWLALARSYRENEKNHDWFRSWIKSNEEMTYAFLDNPFVSQISDFSKVMDGRKDWMDFTVDLAVGSVFPNFLRQSSRAFNPERIERPKKPKDYSVTDALTDASLWKRKMAKSIPFSNQLPYLKNANIPKRDIFGEPMLFEDPVGSMFGVRGFLSDTKPEESKVYSELQRLFWDGDRDLLRTQNYLGDITLDPYDYDALIEYSGKAIKDSLTKVINSPVWEDISREAELNGESGNKAQHDTVLKIKNGIYEAQRNLLLKAEREQDSLTHRQRWGIEGESVPDKAERKQILEDYK